MRKVLDRLYQISGALAGTAIVLITLLIAAQVAANLVTKMRIPGVNLSIPSYNDISGYLLAAASFLGLPYTLVKGGHIRVTLLVGRMGRRPRLVFELLTMAIGLVVAAGGAWYMWQLTGQSWLYGDMSSGIVPIPLWIVQIPPSVGLSILAVAFLDLIVQTAAAGQSPLVDAGSVE
ncbi:MAG: TRAP transporter small permease subunit [Limimaricola sp.]|uniref:TRAP transporter small permease n=1 Tax=Limimaricola sp. TaxID=2211665 RepID=UPI001E1444F9|nr:TRAP transporter small permease [Limimaricola sp.]MBI1417958.1 TRAP transporter small permease subunit [Limimaricola sp.]